MSATPPPTITPTPAPAPQRGDRATFAARFDAFITWITTAVSQFNAAATNVYNNAVDAFTSSTSAASSASASAAAAESASQTAGATGWVSGTTYAKGVCVWSPIDVRTYRRLVAGAGTVDPSSDSTNWVLISIGPLPHLHVRDEQPSGTHGGDSVAATITQTRVLNTTKTNTCGASLASNIITLLAGTYECSIRAPAYNGNNSKAFLYNATDATYTLIGSNASHGTAGAGDNSFISGRFTITASKNFTIRHYTGSTVLTNGLGSAAGSGQVEVYTNAQFWKVA